MGGGLAGQRPSGPQPLATVTHAGKNSDQLDRRCNGFAFDPVQTFGTALRQPTLRAARGYHASHWCGKNALITRSAALLSAFSWCALLVLVKGLFQPSECLEAAPRGQIACQVVSVNRRRQINRERNHSDCVKTPQAVVSPLDGRPAAMQHWMFKALAGTGCRDHTWNSACDKK